MVSIIRKMINLFLNHLYYTIDESNKAVILSEQLSLTRIIARKDGKLHIGKNVIIGVNTRIGCSKEVYIGDEVMIAPNCLIADAQHNYKFRKRERYRNMIRKPCIIKDGAWICYGSVVISSKIGRNSVIGANSTLINFNVPDDHIFKGDTRLNYKMKKIDYQ